MAYLDIAGLIVSCDLPALTDNFRPFLCPERKPDMSIYANGNGINISGFLLEEFVNDAGHIRLYDGGDRYEIEQTFSGMPYMHRMRCNKDFSVCEIDCCPEDPAPGPALSSLVRIAFSQRLVLNAGFLIHSSCVVTQGRAYMFLGKSGTGKSTHSALWIRHIPGTQLLNDDCPAIRIMQGSIYAFGTPWSGKTPCYRQQKAPLAGIVRLRKCGTDAWTSLSGVAAWTAVYPSCSVLNDDAVILSALTDSLNKVVTSTRTGLLDCTRDASAALLCKHNLSIETKTFDN